MRYRYETTTVAGFVQQLAVQYVPHGYWFYVAGNIREGKDPRAVDCKLIERYDVALSRWSKARRRKAGEASVQYLRHERFFLLVATHGRHRFFVEERNAIRDLRREPVRFAGYSMSFRNGRSCVRVAQNEMLLLRWRVERLALQQKADALEAFFRGLSFEPYAPIRRQMLSLLRLANRRRRVAGFAPVSMDCLRFRRRIVAPFGSVAERRDEADAIAADGVVDRPLDGVA